MQIPENVKTFFENCKKRDVHPQSPEPRFNNLYVIQSIDMDGNVTNEKFGFNELTADGYNALPWGFDFLTTIATSDLSFEKKSENSVSHSISNFTAVYYDSDTGLSTQYGILAETQFPYNYDGVTLPVEIAKIGLARSTSPQNIVARSLIYDIDGSVTTFTKNINEKILLKVYIGASVNVKNIVNAAWEDNNYLLLSPLFMLRYAAGLDSSLAEYKPLRMFFGIRTGRTSRMTGANCWKEFTPFNTKTNPQCTRVVDTTVPYAGTMARYMASDRPQDSVIYEKSWASKYIVADSGHTQMSFINMIDANGGFALSEPEEIVVDECMTNPHDPKFTNTLYAYSTSNDNTISSLLYQSRLPVAQFNCTDIEVYNHNTKSWDSETFTQDTNFLYEDTLTYNIWYPVILNGAVVDTYVSVNSKAGLYSMLRFTTDATYVWATDTYWDPTSWELVDRDNPGLLGSKRYYIMDSNTTIVPYYDFTPLQLTNVGTPYSIPRTFTYKSSNNYAIKVLPNPNCNCIVGYSQIVYPDDPNNVVTYNITNYGNNTITGYAGYSYNYQSGTTGTVAMFRLTENGDKLIVANRCRTASTAGLNNNYAAGCYRVYTISDDPTVAPTYEDIQVPYTNQVYTAKTYHSFTDQGFAVAVHNDDQEIAIINLYGANGVEIEMLPGMWGIALNRTNYCVYLDVTDMSVLTFNIYDMSTKTVVDTFSLIGTYVMNGIMGWKNHLYVRVYDTTLQVYTVLYHDISESSNTFIAVNVPLFSQTSESCEMNTEPGGIFDNSFSSCDEAFFIGHRSGSNNYDDYSYEEFVLILDSNPTVCKNPMAEHGWEKGDNNNVQMASLGNFSKSSDGSFVGLEVIERDGNGNFGTTRYGLPSGNCSFYLMDIGRMDDENYLNKTFGSNNQYTYNPGGWGIYVTDNSHNCGVVYKDQRVFQDTNGRIAFEPLAYSRFHRITGTTVSIQTVNNPKRIAPMDEVHVRITG